MKEIESISVQLNESFVKKGVFATLIIGTLGIIGTILIYFTKGHINFNDIDSNKIGAFGGFIGGVFGTTFTISATLLVWLTYTSQKRELEKTSELAQKQFENLEIQQFEITFFNMVDSFLKIPETIQGELPKITEDTEGEKMLSKTVDGDQVVNLQRGRSFFKEAILSFIIFSKENLDVNEREIDEAIIKRLYDRFYQSYLTELDHYFRFFYNILKFIDNSNLKRRSSYADILQALLSKEELALIYYNGLGKIGKVKLYPLLEKYNFLENTNPNLLVITGGVHNRLYGKTTFRFLNEEEKAKRIADVIKEYVESREVSVREAKRRFFELYNCDQARKEEVNQLIK